MSSADLASLVARLEAVTVRLEKTAGSGGGGGDAGPSAASITEFDEFISGPIGTFIAESNKIESEDVKKAAGFLKKLAEEQKKLLVIASNANEPSQQVFEKLLKPLSDVINAIGEIKSRTFKDKVFSNFTTAINEGVAAFAWVTVKPAPAPYVKECGGAAEFYTNRILKEGKHKEWVQSVKAIYSALEAYVKKHHTTGLSWNRDKPIATLSTAPAAPPAPPAPPAAPPAPTPSAASSAPSKPAPDVSALLTDINKGLSVTSGLKKVTDDMKTHKNPALRQGAKPYKPPAAAPKAKPVAKPTTAVAKTPVLELRGKKWIVEHHKDRNDLVISNSLMKQTVYMYKCENCLLQVKGKVNQIILDSCKKTSVVFETIVSSLEFVNCQSVKGQVTGRLPTASIEKTDGCLLYLSEASIDCQIITAKSSEMNISIQKDGDYVEYPIVEQFKTVWDGTTFITEPNESAE